jgi:hypothetical protein
MQNNDTTPMANAKFEELLVNAKDWDPDKKFMAANDLCEAIVKGNLKENDKIARVVKEVFLHQLNDEKNDV